MDYTERMQVVKQMLIYILIAVVVAGIFNGCWFLFFSNWRNVL